MSVGDQVFCQNLQQELDLTGEQMEEIKESFRLFDADGDGSITQVEISKVMGSLGIKATDEDICSMMLEFDADGSGEIEFDEFAKMMATKIREHNSETLINDVWNVFDKDQKGYITELDLLKVMRELEEDEDEAIGLFKAADEDLSGEIDREEFATMMHAC